MGNPSRCSFYYSMPIPGSGTATSNHSRAGFQPMGIFSNANPRYMAVQGEFCQPHAESGLGQSVRTNSGPLPWIHVQIPFTVNDLHAFRHVEKIRIFDVLGKHVVKVFAVDALEFVFGGESAREVSEG